MQGLLKGFPKKVRLKDGSIVTIRVMDEKDEEKLLQFFRTLPPSILNVLSDDVTNRAVIKRWIVEELDYERVLPLLSEHEGKIIANSSLKTNRTGWMRHVGEIQVIVHPEHQRKGLGTILVKELIQHAALKGLQKIILQLMKNQKGEIKAMEGLGFVKEAILKNHVLDWEGKPHDLVILSNNVAELWRRMEDLIIDSEFIVHP